MTEVRTKITHRRERGPAGGLSATLLAFGLLCVGVLLLADRGPRPAAAAATGNQREGIADAIDATRGAESALQNENYGEARALVTRARTQLEQLAQAQTIPSNPSN
jgi:hypothetical protein